VFNQLCVGKIRLYGAKMPQYDFDLEYVEKTKLGEDYSKYVTV